jgi:hypothetical protein
MVEIDVSKSIGGRLQRGIEIAFRCAPGQAYLPIGAEIDFGETALSGLCLRPGTLRADCQEMDRSASLSIRRPIHHGELIRCACRQRLSSGYPWSMSGRTRLPAGDSAPV